MKLPRVGLPVLAAGLLAALVLLVLVFFLSTTAMIWAGLAVGIAVGVVIAATSAKGEEHENGER